LCLRVRLNQHHFDFSHKGTKAQRDRPDGKKFILSELSSCLCAFV
jgi:hypothetical protein